MSNRSSNMRKVNAVRSAKTTAMIDFLMALETAEGDFGGFSEFNIKRQMSIGQLNSYRANKILNHFDKSISKKHLAVFSKDTNYTYKLTNADIAVYLQEYDKELKFYLDFYIKSYINDALTLFDVTTHDNQD